MKHLESPLSRREFLALIALGALAASLPAAEAAPPPNEGEAREPEPEWLEGGPAGCSGWKTGSAPRDQRLGDTTVMMSYFRSPCRPAS